jgi:uncharacterized Zn-binding protein involved in type VI secretion
MPSVAIHPPKTPVTAGSMGTAKATLPNVCKMPGPPAPFVPSPLPNIAKSGNSPKDYSTSVTIEGNAVAIRGASFESMGDMASKGTGGGLISANTHGPAKFITPGSLTVKIEGKSVHLLGEPMLNNCGPSGSPPNTGATMVGLDQIDKKVKQVLGDADALAVCEAICNNYGPGGDRGAGAQRDLDKAGVGKGEQTQYLPKATTAGAKKGNPVPGTFQTVTTRAGNVARSSTGCGAGNTVRWDRNIKGKWVEFKGDNEPYTDNQEEARKQSGKKQPDLTVRPKNCGCPE